MRFFLNESLKGGLLSQYPFTRVQNETLLFQVPTVSNVFNQNCSEKQSKKMGVPYSVSQMIYLLNDV